MKSDNKIIAKLWKLQTSANELVLEGKREPDTLIRFLQRFVFGNTLPNIDWHETYSVLGMAAKYSASDLGNIMCNNAQEGTRLWFVPVLQGVTCDRVINAMSRVGLKVTLYTTMGLSINDRDPNVDGSYGVGFKKSLEADEENKNKSANMLKQENHKGITLLERLILELGYFLTAGQNLDVKSDTLCTGSRYDDGGVPCVRSNPDTIGICISWCGSAVSEDKHRSRSAVS